MIQLDANAQAYHAPFAVTHAKRSVLQFVRLDDGQPVPPALHATMSERFYLVYAFGTLDSIGAFVPDPKCPPVELNLCPVMPPTFIGPNSSSLIPEPASVTAQRAAANAHNTALANLLGAGVAPTPGSPDIPVTVPNKRAGDFKGADVDAVASTRHTGLAGTVVA